MLYEAKYGRNCLDDPYIALERDGAILGEDLDEDMLMRAAHETKLTNLESLISAQRNVLDKVRSQVDLYQSKYSLICKELEDERQNQETPKSNKTKQPLFGWEKEIQKLKEELAFERVSSKGYQEDLALMVSVVETMRQDLAKHKSVGLELVKERKLLGECLMKDRQRLRELEEAALGEESAKLERVMEEKMTLLTSEIMNLQERLRQEEQKSRNFKLECDQLREQLERSQGQQKSTPSINDISRPGSNPTLKTSGTPSSFTVTGRVPLENAPALAQRALASAPHTYRSPSATGSLPSPGATSSQRTTPNHFATPTVGGGPRLNLQGQPPTISSSSGQRISLHATSPSKPLTAGSTSPMVVQVSNSQQLQQQQNRPNSAQVKPVVTPRPVVPLSPSNHTSSATPVAVSSSFNITIRPDGKGISTFLPNNHPPEPPLRSSERQMPSVSPGTASQTSGAYHKLDSTNESSRYMTIKKMGVASHSLNH